MNIVLTGSLGNISKPLAADLIAKIIFVSPQDIAEVVAEELVNPPTEKVKIRYMGSEEMICSEAEKIIGTAVGKPYFLHFVTFLNLPSSNFLN